jgi:dTDP-glucose 4,6-dehydratase
MSPYASAKCGADRLVYSYWATYKIPCSIIRPFNSFGPRQHLEKVIPRFITSVLLGEKLTVHGTGGASRDFVFVEDICRGVDAVLHAERDKVDGEVFNIATGIHRSVHSIARDILKVMGGDESSIIFHGDRPGQVVRHSGDASKISKTFGWKSQMTWEEGLKTTIEWYKANRAWWEKQVWMRQIPITSAAGKKEYH